MVMSQESINRLNDDLWEVERAGVESAAKLSKAEFRSSSQEDLKEFGREDMPGKGAGCVQQGDRESHSA